MDPDSVAKQTKVMEGFSYGTYEFTINWFLTILFPLNWNLSIKSYFRAKKNINGDGGN